MFRPAHKMPLSAASATIDYKKQPTLFVILTRMNLTMAVAVWKLGLPDKNVYTGQQQTRVVGLNLAS